MVYITRSLPCWLRTKEQAKGDRSRHLCHRAPSRLTLHSSSIHKGGLHDYLIKRSVAHLPAVEQRCAHQPWSVIVFRMSTHTPENLVNALVVEIRLRSSGDSSTRLYVGRPAETVISVHTEW